VEGNLTKKDWLETAAYLVAIVGGISAAVVYFQGVRKESISVTRKEIVRTWTNEGDISSKETRYITLELENKDGELIGSLSTNTRKKSLDVHAQVGWFSTELTFFDLQGRNVVSVASAKVSLEGNNNRMEWSLSENATGEDLPQQTVLWPHAAGDLPK